jgi:hypothetical protein
MLSNQCVSESLNTPMVKLHALLSLNPSSLLLRCSLSSVTSLTSGSMWPDVLVSTLVFWDLSQCRFLPLWACPSNMNIDAVLVNTVVFWYLIQCRFLPLQACTSNLNAHVHTPCFNGLCLSFILFHIYMEYCRPLRLLVVSRLILVLTSDNSWLGCGLSVW